MQSIEKSFYYSAKMDFLILPNADSIPTASNFSSFGKIIIEGQQERENKPRHADIKKDKVVIKSPLSIEKQKINRRLQCQECYQKRKKIETLKKEVEDFSHVYKQITNLHLAKKKQFPN